jgi:hypothetical protein
MTKPTEFFRWLIQSDTLPGKRIQTRHHMTREQALARDPTATPIPGTREVRNLPENEEEVHRMMHRLPTKKEWEG